MGRVVSGGSPPIQTQISIPQKHARTGGRDWYALLREVLVNMHGKGGGGGGHRPGHVSVHDHHRAPISPKQIVAYVWADLGLVFLVG